MATSCAGLSLSSHSASPGEQPIVNLPGGIQTYVSPSFGFTFVVPTAMVDGGAAGASGGGGGIVTLTLAEAVVVPPRPVAIRVYAVEPSGCTRALPVF